MINYRSVPPIIFGTLITLTALTLVLNPPDAVVFAQNSGPFLLFALLTIFALVFPAVLLKGELSGAHAIGVMAALALPPFAFSTSLWSIAIGSAIGGITIAVMGERRLPGQNPQERSVRTVLMLIARVTLSFYVATLSYATLGGIIPVQLDALEQVPRVMAFCVLYTAFYLILFILETYGRNYGLRYILRINAPEIVTVLGLPLPLAVLGAHIYNSLSLLAFTICVTGLALAIITPYIISRAQKQLRKQVEELRSLSVMSQAIRANYEYKTLMNMVYVQVSNLLEARNFVVALVRPDQQELEFPLVIRGGRQVDGPNTPLAPNTPIARVLETQLPLLLSRNAHKEGHDRGLQMPRGVYSWLGVPLQAGGSLYGALVVSSYGPERIFTPDDLRLLNIVAASASVALENTLLYERQITRAQRLSLLNNILAQLSETLSPDAVLDTVVDKATLLSGAEGATVMLLEGGDGLRVMRSKGVSAALAAQMPALLQEGDIRQPLAVPVNGLRDPELRSRFESENIAAWMELPLFVAGTPTGALALYYRQPQQFDDGDIELLRAFSTQAAQAIRNAREYRRADEALSRRVGQLMALATISHEMTATLDARQICAMVLQFALNATYTHIGTVMLKDDFGELDVLAQAGYPLEGVSRRDLLRQWITHEALKGEPVVIPDLSARTEIVPLTPTLHAQLAAPIVRRGEIIGVITLESEQINGFANEDKEFIQQLSDQAVIAIDNTRLFRDITEGRDRLRLILDNMSEPLLLIDRGGTIALANPRVDKLGLSVDLILGQTVESLLEYQDIAFAEHIGFDSPEAVQTLVKSLGTQVVEPQHYSPQAFKLELNNEQTYFERNVLPVHDENNSIIGILLVFYDQTESRKLAAAREDFARMIIHDLRSPLTAVTTSLKLMNDIVPADSDYKSVVETSSTVGRRAIKKLLGRVDSLLDVAKMESGQLALETRPSEIATLIDSVCVELSPLAHELNVSVVSDLSDDFPLLSIDPDKVERVLLNLLDNALKFSPEESSVIMRGRTSALEGVPAGFVRMEVVDHGPGIPEDLRSNIFDRFVQVQGRSGRRRGTGLGLTFCRLVVESHGGRIWIEDNPNGGSIFAFTLPISSDKGLNGDSAQ